jgi:hypothetical protein
LAAPSRGTGHRRQGGNELGGSPARAAHARIGLGKPQCPAGPAAIRRPGQSTHARPGPVGPGGQTGLTERILAKGVFLAWIRGFGL